MSGVIQLTLKSIFRDRVFRGIMFVCLSLLLIPSISALSMRQVTELSITLSLSVISIVLLLLAVFLGGSSLWKDIERRYTYSVLSLPMSRGRYLIGKFLGTALFLLIVDVAMGGVACLVINISSTIYPAMREIVWINVLLDILFEALKYILLASFSFLFSVVSTSLFLPLFGTLAVFFIGSASQEVFDYVSSPIAARMLSPFVITLSKYLYYLLPNFSAFDLKIYAIYSIAPNLSALLFTFLYFIVYTSLVLVLSILIFQKRELK